MGRQEPSQGLAPPPVRKQQRAKHARLTINKTIPALLAADARARKGVEQSILIRNPITSQGGDPGSRPKSDGRKSHTRKQSQSKDQSNAVSDGHSGEAAPADETDQRPQADGVKRPEVLLRYTDSLTAAYDLQADSGKASRNVGLLNMASVLRPGGGVLQGATSQEEFLCTRTTLLPSLKDEYYRLPDVGGILSRDILVFRLPARANDPIDSTNTESDRELSRTERFYIDIVSAGMLRTPELVDEGGEVCLASQKDAELVVQKMEAVREMFLQQGVRKIVLGAWGCGAYGNPIPVIARSWRKVLLDASRSKDRKGIDFTHVVFAIKDRKMAGAFAEAWGDEIKISADEVDNATDEEEDLDEQNARELDERIEQMRAQLEATKFPMMRDRLSSILDGLVQQRQGSAKGEHDRSD